MFCTAAVPDATSNDVLRYQIPQVHLFFKNTGESYRKVVTLTVGGNDALSVLNPDGTLKPPEAILAMLQAYTQNLSAILSILVGMEDVNIYVGNMYDPRLPVAGGDLLVNAMNQVVAGVVSAFPARVVLVDIYSAFQGRNGLLLNERHGVEPSEVHPTDTGYAVMADAFAEAIGKGQR